MAFILLDDSGEPQPRLSVAQSVTLLLVRAFIFGVVLLEVYLIAAVLS